MDEQRLVPDDMWVWMEKEISKAGPVIPASFDMRVIAARASSCSLGNDSTNPCLLETIFVPMTSYNNMQCCHCRNALKEADGPLDDKWNSLNSTSLFTIGQKDGINWSASSPMTSCIEALPVYNT